MPRIPSSISRSLAALISVACLVGVAPAAEITVTGYSVVLEGQIEPGDYDRLRDNLIVKRSTEMTFGAQQFTRWLSRADFSRVPWRRRCGGDENRSPSKNARVDRYHSNDKRQFPSRCFTSRNSN